MKVECSNCGDIIESSLGNLVMCKCSKIGLDDLGSGYMRIIGDGWEIIQK